MLGSHDQRLIIIGLGTLKISPGDCNVQPRWRMAGRLMPRAACPLSLVLSSDGKHWRLSKETELSLSFAKNLHCNSGKSLTH